MDRKNSFGSSWADQWDYGSDPSPRAARDGSGGGKKQSDVEKTKTKAVAATGLKKVKEGTAQGFQWVKDKFQMKKQTGGEGAGIAGY